MAFNRFYVISPLALVAVSACRSPYIAQNAVGGAVVKGPLSNALVFLDYNDDGVLDANEPFARTDSFGQYELAATQSEYTLVAMADYQTVDTSSGAALSGITLTAPSGAGVITPTTTLMEEGGISAEDVAAVLGLPDGIDPLTFNPFDVDENDAAAVAAALEVEKVSQQIMTAVTSFASAAEGAGAGAGDAFTAALGSVVDVVKTKADKIDDPTAAAADKEIDFTNAADLALIKTEATSKAAALDGIDAATMNALADDTTAAIKNVNDKIATVTDLDADETKNIFSTMQVLQDQVKEAAETQKAGGVANISFKDSAAVDTAALNSAPEAITLSGARLVSADGDLVVGTVATIDPDPNDTTFTYTLLGPDAGFFDFESSSGKLSLKAAPNYAEKPYYEITIQSKDPGGKPYSETFIIDVVPDLGTLIAADPTVASDFEMVMMQNPLFMDMKSHTELKQTSDGQLVLVELMSSDDGDYGSPSGSDSDGPIMAFIDVTDRGYELLNPATKDYMGGFFTYEEDGLTYTGYEVFVDDMSVLAEYEEALIKYFAPDSTYGSGALNYTERDIEFVSIVGAKAVDKDGHTVQEMLGFSHYDKDMNILGSAGVDVADPSKPYYIEVVGEYDPAKDDNITRTDLTVDHDASVGLEMQTKLQDAGKAILYGDDYHDGATAVNGGGISTETPSETPTVAPVAAPPLKPLNTVEYDVTVVDGKYLIDGVLLETLDLDESKTYRFNQSDSSNANHALKFSEAVDGAEYTKNVVTFGTPGEADAFSQITIPYKSPDLHIFCENHSGMGFPLTTTTNYAGTTDSGELKIQYVAVNEFESGSYIGEIVYDTTAYPDATFATHSLMASESMYPFELVEGTSVFLKSDWFYQSSFGNDGLPHLVHSSGNSRDFADQYAPVEVWLSVTDGPSSLALIDMAEAVPLFNVLDTPLITMEDFQYAGNELGAVLGTFNYGFTKQFIKVEDFDFFEDREDPTSNVIDVDPFEIVGDKFKLKDNFSYDPSFGVITSTSGDTVEWLYTNAAGDNYLPSIDIYSYETQAGLEADTAILTDQEREDQGIDRQLVASIDVSTFFDNVDPVPLTYYGISEIETVPLHPSDDKINALLPEGNTDGEVPLFKTDPYYSNSVIDPLVGDNTTIITYSFISDDTYFTPAASVAGHRPQIGTDTVFEFSDAHKAATRQIMSEYSKIADLYFVEVEESIDEVGTMRFGFTDHVWGSASGWASSPGGGDVWIFSDTGLPSDDFFDIGSMGAITMLHEVGHALGLNHSFEGNLFAQENLYLDSNQYTVMSYSSHSDVGVWIGDNYYYTVSETPMLLDVAALRHLYGEQENTNLGDTTYTFDDDLPFAKVIWDAGVNDDDVLDFSNFTTDLIVSLVPGTSSTIPTTIPTGTWEMTDNLGIAEGSDGTGIENVIAGSGDDKIIGNDLDNVLTGGAGADVFEFNDGFGSDTITDFVVGTDALRFLDSGSAVITDPSSFTAAASADQLDLVLSIGSDELVLTGLGTTNFDVSFLEIT